MNLLSRPAGVLLVMALLSQGASGCQTPEKTKPDDISVYELNLILNDFATENFSRKAGYRGMHGAFDPRLGVVLFGAFTRRISPMNQNKDFLEDLRRSEKAARALAELPYLEDRHRIVIAMDTPIVEQVRVWNVGFLRTDEDSRSEETGINDRLYMYNGIEKREGGYPQWSSFHASKEKLIGIMKKRGYQSAGFFLPLFGPVIFVDEPVSRVDRVFMQTFHKKSEKMYQSFDKLSPGMLLVIGDQKNRLHVLQDFSATGGQTSLYPIFFGKQIEIKKK